jgi:hypothetical protein
MEAAAGVSQQSVKIGVERAVEVVLEHEVGAVLFIFKQNETRKVQRLQRGEGQTRVVRYVTPDVRQQTFELCGPVGSYSGDERKDSVRHDSPPLATADATLFATPDGRESLPLSRG